MTGGIPLPNGICWATDEVSVVDQHGRTLPLQAAVLDRWPDGSLRWLLLDLVADRSSTCRLRLSGDSVRATPRGRLETRTDGQRVTVQAGPQTFVMSPAEHLFEFTNLRGLPIRPFVTVTDASGETTRASFTTIAVERDGPVRAVVAARGTIAVAGTPLGITARVHFAASSSALRIDLSILNPRAAVHAGNFWELGDGGSTLFKDLSLHVNVPSPGSAVTCSAGPGQAAISEPRLTLYQDSSGGENWQSSVHVNRDGRIPMRFNGYRLETTGSVIEGRRASPVMQVTYDGGAVAAGVRDFWQNFPKALAGDTTGLVVGLFPHQWDDLHELQGGEQKTHTVALGFDALSAAILQPALAPPVLSCEPSWFEECQAVPSLSPVSASVSPDYERLINAALDGDASFTMKRERIDEYGWRNFGDIYADHEAVGNQSGRPLVSHYNNQYDAIAGFAIQFMRSGDVRWFSAMEELAAHVTDIDLYHTDEDKSAFSRGMFWHTAHYVDAGRSTHRTYPHATGVSGGGPSNEHDYSTGLLLHHLLTGDERSRAGVIELVSWVTAMDDGDRTVFRFLSRGATGLASSTVSPTYHGPGRGAGNSIATLMNGYRLTGERALLTRAESLIRRCIHPADDIAGKELLDAERRWSYTVFLQVLGKYLGVKTLLGEFDEDYAYARASLTHYGRWMAAHEYLYLDKPHLLEYPNETWAAQDIRKAEVLATVAHYAAGADRELMLERSRYFSTGAISMLTACATRTLARPVVILLSTGHNLGKLQTAEAASRREEIAVEFRPSRGFIPQKTQAIRNALVLSALGAAITAAVFSYALVHFLG